MGETARRFLNVTLRIVYGEKSIANDGSLSLKPTSIYWFYAVDEPRNKLFPLTIFELEIGSSTVEETTRISLDYKVAGLSNS